MRDIAEFNFPAFHTAAAKLRAAGHFVFNPAENDVARFGTLPHNPSGCEATLAQHLGWTELEVRRTLFSDDMEFICREAEAIALLPGWENSKGAKAEKATAEALGLEVIYV